MTSPNFELKWEVRDLFVHISLQSSEGDLPLGSIRSSLVADASVRDAFMAAMTLAAEVAVKEMIGGPVVFRKKDP